MNLIKSAVLLYSNSINSETRIGNPINNIQSINISHLRTQFKLLSKYTEVKERSNESGFFNCHGLVFGNRRIEIEQTTEVFKILHEDNYKEVLKENVLPGDVVIYIHEGDIIHSGIVIEQPIEPFFVPKIISKWGSYKEIIHKANYGPYKYNELKYYRIWD